MRARIRRGVGGNVWGCLCFCRLELAGRGACHGHGGVVFRSGP